MSFRADGNATNVRVGRRSNVRLRMPKKKPRPSNEVGASASVVRLRACGLRAQGDGGSAPTSEKTASNATGRYPDLRFVGLRRLPGLCVRAYCALRQLRLRDCSLCLAQRRELAYRITKRTSGIVPRPPRLQWRGRGGLSPSLPCGPRALDSDAYVKVRRRSGRAHCAASIGRRG